MPFISCSDSSEVFFLSCIKGRNRWLGKLVTTAILLVSFSLSHGDPSLKVVAQDGTPLPAEHLISSVNLRVVTTHLKVVIKKEVTE